MQLTVEQKSAFEEQGFLLVEGALTDDDIDPKIFYQNKIFMSHLTEEEKRKHKEFIININGLNKWSIYS